MSYEEFLDEVKVLQYACPFGVMINTENFNGQVIPFIHKSYNSIRGPIDYSECIEYYKKWVKEINESEIKKHGYHFTHEYLLEDAKNRFKLEKENPGKIIYKHNNNWEIYEKQSL